MPMHFENLSHFFGTIAGMSDAALAREADAIYRGLDKLIVAFGKDSFVRDLARALETIGDKPLTPTQHIFTKAAIDAGIVKAIGRFDQGPRDPKKSVPYRERDFGAALGLAERWKTICAQDCDAQREICGRIAVFKEHMHISGPRRLNASLNANRV